MLTPAQIERFPIELESKFSTLEMSIMQDIVRRINISGNITSTADWQLVRLKQLGQSNKYIRDTLAIMLGKSDKDVNELFKSASQQEYARDKELYTKVNAEFIPYSKNLELQQFVKSISNQTTSTFNNITNTLGFATQSGGKVVNVELSAYYTKTLDKAMLDISSGAFTKEQVLKRVIKEMTDSGLRTIDYESGYSSRVNVVARRALNTGLGQLTAKVNEINADKLGTDLVETSWHGTSRPSHQIWQGKIFKWNR